jgi:hypothetical protein
MSSTITKKTLTISINETIDIGKTDDYSNKTKFTISGIGEVSKRILTVPTHQVSVLTLSSSAGAGTFASGSLKYARITNLDNENYVRLTFMSSSAGSVKNKSVFKLDPLRSFIVTNDAYSGSGVGTTFDTFQSFTDIKAKSNSSSCDVEIYIASK